MEMNSSFAVSVEVTPGTGRRLGIQSPVLDFAAFIK